MATFLQQILAPQCPYTGTLVRNSSSISDSRGHHKHPCLKHRMDQSNGWTKLMFGAFISVFLAINHFKCLL